MQTIIRTIDKSVAFLENFLIILILTVMVLMSFLQVILRNFFSTGLLWGDVFLRHLVLWVGFMGASLATRENRHINIDVLSKIVAQKWLPTIRMITNLITIVICTVLAKASYVFVLSEYRESSILFSNIPSWPFQMIIPIGFTLIGFRFLLKMVEGFLSPSEIVHPSKSKNDHSDDQG